MSAAAPASGRRLLLTGAAGFTGRALRAAAEAAGDTVLALDADLRDPAALAAGLAAAGQGGPIDAVVHLAALAFVGHDDPGAFYAVNTVGTAWLLDALARQPWRPRRLLVASSANVYGNNPDFPLAETEPPAPVNHYAASKLAMEHLARSAAEAAGLPLLLTRPFNYTGPGQSPSFVVPKLVDHFARRAPFVELGNLDVEREYNDVDFVVQAMRLLLDHGQPGTTVNLCTGRTHTLRALIARLEALSGHRLDVRVNPAFVRAHEVQRLGGDPARLQALWARAGRAWPAPDLDALLARMLAAAAPR